MKPRWIEHLRAALGGYFWLPCPNCGRMFSGREWEKHPNNSLWNGTAIMLRLAWGQSLIRALRDSAHATCNNPTCVAEVKEKNRQIAEANNWWLEPPP